MSGLSSTRATSLRPGGQRYGWKRVFGWQYVPQRLRQAMRRDAALVARLKAGARLADTGVGTDTTGMTDDAFLELLRRR